VAITPSGVREIPIATLTRFPGNARRGNVAEIRASVRRLGQYRTIVVRDTGSDLVILAGNHTADALAAEGHENARCEVITCTDDEARRVNLTDNRLAELPGPDGERYDDEALVELLSYLDGDYEGTGWTEEDVSALIEPPEDTPGGNGDPDDAPEPPAEPVSAFGDLWLLGPHRLLIGDATNPDHLALATEGLGTPGIVYTDPPYGIDIVSSAGKVGASIGYPVGGAKNGGQGSKGTVRTTSYLPVAGDDSTDAAVDAFRLLYAEYPDAMHIWWGGNHYAASAGLPDSSCWLVWDKDTNGNFADAELAWTSHPGAVRLLRHMWNGMLRASERGKRVHPTQKPVALAEWAFGVIDPKDERSVVLDVFAGSGSTLLAAHRTKRTAALIEMEPAYGDVIAGRWEAFTGIKPERVLPDGTTEPVSFT
jgi:hypothetical protein